MIICPSTQITERQGTAMYQWRRGVEITMVQTIKDGGVSLYCALQITIYFCIKICIKNLIEKKIKYTVLPQTLVYIFHMPSQAFQVYQHPITLITFIRNPSCEVLICWFRPVWLLNLCWQIWQSNVTPSCCTKMWCFSIGKIWYRKKSRSWPWYRYFSFFLVVLELVSNKNGTGKCLGIGKNLISKNSWNRKVPVSVLQIYWKKYWYRLTIWVPSHTGWNKLHCV